VLNHHHWMNHANQVNEMRSDEGETFGGMKYVENVDNHYQNHYMQMWTMRHDLLYLPIGYGG
jgi:hypothetical protein